MKTLLAILMLAAACAVAQDAKIIPVDAWPKKITTADKVIFNPTPEQCVKAGYRLIPAKPSTPDGKQIKSAELVQDDKKTDAAKWVIVYEDIPAQVVPVPEVLTNVSADKVQFTFTADGSFRGVKWVDAPKTNEVVK
jgi:putative hemolysin